MQLSIYIVIVSEKSEDLEILDGLKWNRFQFSALAHHDSKFLFANRVQIDKSHSFTTLLRSSLRGHDI